MERGFTRRLTIGLAAAVALALPGTALAAPHRTVNLTPANGASSPVTWDGTLHDGANANYDSGSGAPCGEDTNTYCDDTLVNVNVPEGFRGGAQVDINDYRPNPLTDFDLYVYESDAGGDANKLLTNDGTFGVVLNGNGLPNGVPETFAFGVKSGYYLVRVVYFDAPVPSQYTGSLQVNEAPGRLDHPQDVDSPPGLQEHLASNPSLGFRSHSEPHIAQSPINPDIMVAGSKQYYRDRDSLKEYEFKIGTYVSFDHGVSWTDLGQIDVCPTSQAPQETWPDRNTCYPDEDPNKGGTGPEDVKSDNSDTAYDDRGSGDIAEEYTTSDIWLQFDDEGNAYVMVLDSPPFPIDDPELPLLGDPPTEGNGWGMTMHKWDTVSPADVASGHTWGPRVPINFYADQVREREFLDDKNTMAVNNAGPDKDGKPGIIVTCWGRGIQPAKQEIVCERSTDGGKSFPDDPTPVSEPQNLVIGVDVVPDQKDENTFYLVWNHYIAVTSPLNELYFAKTTDGGVTWTPPIPITTPFTPLPGTYPGQQFRQQTMPMIVASPNGDLYVTYADYRDAPDPATDEDGSQADIEFLKSTDGGVTWSQPSVVNQDKSNADQFQPQITTTPQGEIAINYFDRRNDKRVVTGGKVVHSGNFFVDEYLSRSTDGGATWQDTRLSHAMSNPELNTPIDSNGRFFFGDYQGLVADECYATPFMQDTHLAEDADTDRGFDEGFPRSKYQETFSWQVPNLKQAASCRAQVVNPPVTRQGLPRVTLTAPRLASDVSASNRFDLRINASAANIGHYELQYQRPTSRGWRRLSSNLKTATYRFRGSYSATYRFRARAVDLAGDAGPWSSEKVTVVPHDDARSHGRPRYSGSWKRVKTANAYAKRVSQSSRRGSRMRMNFRGTRLYLVGRRSPAGGLAEVRINGRRRGRIDFYNAKVQSRRVLFSIATSARRTNRVELVVLGRKGARASSGKLVELDAVGYRGL